MRRQFFGPTTATASRKRASSSLVHRLLLFKGPTRPLIFLTAPTPAPKPVSAAVEDSAEGGGGDITEDKEEKGGKEEEEDADAEAEAEVEEEEEVLSSNRSATSRSTSFSALSMTEKLIDWGISSEGRPLRWWSIRTICMRIDRLSIRCIRS
jgi:hypothetical protein